MTTDPLDDLLARLDAKADTPPAATPGEALMAALHHDVPPAPPRENDWLDQALAAHVQDRTTAYERLFGPNHTNH